VSLHALCPPFGAPSLVSVAPCSWTRTRSRLCPLSNAWHGTTKIHSLAAAGKTEQTNGRLVHLSQSAVSRVIHPSLPAQPRACGRPRQHSRADDKTLVKHAKRARTEPSRLTAHWMQLHRGRSLSSSTICRILLGAGLRSSWTVKSPRLQRPRRNCAFATPSTTGRSTGTLSFATRHPSTYARASTGFAARPRKSLPRRQQPSIPPKSTRGTASRPGARESSSCSRRTSTRPSISASSRTTWCPHCVR